MIPTDAENQVQFIDYIKNSDFMVPYLLNKKWVYHYSDSDLYISDNPISMQNNLKERSEFRGNIGLDVKGIEIYFPISSREVITLICEKFFHEIENTYMKDPAGTDRSSNYRIRNFVNYIRRRIPTELHKETVLNYNSLQVIYAERYIISENENFELIEDMLKNPKLRIGPRTKVGW